MQRQFIYGLSTGLAAALLIALLHASDHATQVFLHFIIPLPVFIAGLAAGWQAAAISTLIAGAVVSIIIGPAAGITASIVQLAPAVMLTYLILLHRDPESSTPKTTQAASNGKAIQWYPIGWVILWAVALASTLAFIAMTAIHSDLDQLTSVMRATVDGIIDRGLARGAQNEEISEADRVWMTELMVRMIPPAMAIAASASFLLSLWLGGHITRAAGLLQRPWPDVAAITYPAGTSLALAATLAASWLIPGTAGYAISAVAGGLVFGFILMGLAIIHYVSRENPWRTFILVCTYIALIIFNTTAWLLLAIIALAEPISPLRRDFIAAAQTKQP